MADEKANKIDEQPDAKPADLPVDRRDRFTWHPDEIMIVKRDGVEIPPTKLSDLVAREKAEEQARKNLADSKKVIETGDGK